MADCELVSKIVRLVLKAVQLFLLTFYAVLKNCHSGYFLRFICKVCAANFGDICSVVGQQATEEMLVSYLLKDFSFQCKSVVDLDVGQQRTDKTIRQ